MLRRGTPCLCFGGHRLVGSQNGHVSRGKSRWQRFHSHCEAAPGSLRLQHAAFLKRLGDGAPLPGFPMRPLRALCRINTIMGQRQSSSVHHITQSKNAHSGTPLTSAFCSCSPSLFILVATYKRFNPSYISTIPSFFGCDINVLRHDRGIDYHAVSEHKARAVAFLQ